MPSFFHSALTRTACASLAAITPALVAASVAGIAPVRAVSAAGMIAAILLLAITTMAFHEKVRIRTLLRSGAYVALCSAILLSLLRTPPLSDFVQTAAHGAILAAAPAIVIVICTAASIRDHDTRRLMIRWIVTGPALSPVLMLAYDTATGSAAQYMEQWLAGVRVMDTGLVTSPNVNALIGAFGALASMWLALEHKARLLLIGGAAGIFYLLISQSQGVMISFAIAVGAMLLPRLLSASVMRILIIVWAASAPAQVAVYDAMEGTSIGYALTRAEGAHLGVGTGRGVIWSAAIREIAGTPSNYMLGTGFMSAPGTSVLPALSQVIAPSDLATLYQRVYSLHNAALQLLFDSGTIGLALMVYCLIKMTSVPNAGRMNALVLFILLSGLNEAIGTIYAIATFVPFFALIGAHCVGRDHVAAGRVACDTLRIAQDWPLGPDCEISRRARRNRIRDLPTQN